MTTAAQPDEIAVALARLYDVDLLEDPGDVDLYRAMAARADGPVLELAVGSGRLAVPLAVDGHAVTGVDIDPAMLARARARAAAAGRETAARLRLVEADAVDVRLPDAGAYRLAYVGLNSILLMPGRAAQRAVVATLAAHLAPGGIAIVDALQPSGDELAAYDGRLILSYVRNDPETGHVVTKAGAATYDPAARTIELTTIFEEGPAGRPSVRWIREDRLRLVAPDDLVEFAELAGLEPETLAGDFDLGPLGPASERAVLVARRA